MEERLPSFGARFLRWSWGDGELGGSAPLIGAVTSVPAPLDPRHDFDHDHDRRQLAGTGRSEISHPQMTHKHFESKKT